MGPSSSDFINAADGELGVSFLDEAAERAAFQEAVAGRLEKMEIDETDKTIMMIWRVF